MTSKALANFKSLQLSVLKTPFHFCSFQMFVNSWITDHTLLVICVHVF